MDKFFSFIEKFIPLPDEERSYLLTKFELKNYETGTIIHHTGEICTSIRFITSGIVRSYFSDMEGKDFTWHIHFYDERARFKNLFIVDYASFIAKQPSSFSFEVLDNARITEINYDDLQKAYQMNEKWQMFGRIMAEQAYLFTQQRTLSLLTEPAEVRVRNFLKDTPFLMEIVPQYYIASMLGIAPQSFSRLRNKIFS